MANYIVSLDTSTYANAGAAELALTNAGAAITKTYQFPLTYGVTATTSQLASLAGVLRYEEIGTVLTAQKAGGTPTYHHLQSTSVNKNYNYYWHPVDTTHGQGQHVYLLDTGIDIGHQEFGNATNVNNLYNCTNATGFVDTDGHGTAIASLIVGGAVGIAANATLHNVKMFDNGNGNVTVGEIVDALDNVLTHHNNNSPAEPKVVCMPFTVTKNQLIDDKLNELLDENLMLVACAGNRGNGDDVDNYSPGGLDTITTVASHDEYFYATTFSQLPLKNGTWDSDNIHGANTTIVRKLVQNAAEIDIFAIGTNVSVADHANVSNYNTVNGTSASAALVAGAATHFMNLYSSNSAQTIKSYMVSRGHEAAKLRRSTTPEGAEHHHPVLAYDNLTFPVGKTADWDKISLSILSVPMTSQVSFTTIPSGRLLDVQYGQTANINIGLSNAVSNVAVLDFSPLSPWMSFNTSTGVFVSDTSNATLAPANVSPGIYHFAVKGQIGDTVHVEEYSVGVYENDVSELNSATEFYYDDDEEAYEEVVAYNVGFFTVQQLK